MDQILLELSELVNDPDKSGAIIDNMVASITTKESLMDTVEQQSNSSTINEYPI